MSVSKFEGAAQAAPTITEALQRAIEEAIAQEQLVEKLEDDLKAAKQLLYAYRSRTIPDILMELGVDELTFHGWKIKVDDFVGGNLPTDPQKREHAIQLLHEYGADSLLKVEVKANFGKGESLLAREVESMLRNAGYDPEYKESIHSQTLQAFARQRLRDGDPIDAEGLGLMIGKVAKLKQVKKA